MLYHNYLEMLLGSRVKVKILRTLCRHSGKEFTIRELAEFLDISHTGIRKALDDLYRMNIIRVKVIGKSHTIAINTDSYAAELAENLFRMEDATLDDLVQLLRRRLGNHSVTSAMIFGSIVRREEDPLSDIDLLVQTRDREEAEAVISELQREVSNRFGNAISPYILSEERVTENVEEHILEEIRKKHIVVIEKPSE